MKRINLAKFGFIRSEQDDFSDDGSYFTCYRVGRIRVSKTTYQGEAFISARLEGGELPYKVYSQLNSYEELDRLNGISIESLTEDDLQRLYEACQSYQHEYEEAEASTHFPTLEELKAKRDELNKIYNEQLADLDRMFSVEVFLKMSDSESKTFRDFYKSLQNKRVDDERLESYVNRYASFSYMNEKADTRYYEYCKKILIHS